MLKTIAFSQMPLTQQMLLNIAKLNTVEWQSVQSNAIEYLHVTPPDPYQSVERKFQPFHASFGRFLRDQFKGEKEECHIRFAEYCLRWKDISDEYENEYALRFGPYHLVETENWENLIEIYAFLDVRVNSDAVFKLIWDLEHTINEFSSENKYKDVIRQISEALKIHAAFLFQHPDHLLQCLQQESAPTWSQIDTPKASNVLAELVDKWRGETSDKLWIRTIVRPDPPTIPVFRFHSSKITALAVIPPQEDGEVECIVSCSSDGRIMLWDAEGRSLKFDRSPENPHIAREGGSVTTRSRHFDSCIQWAPSGQRLAIGNSEGNVNLWQIGPNQLEQLPGCPIHSFPLGQDSFVPVKEVTVSDKGVLCAATARRDERVHVAQLKLEHPRNVDFRLPDNDICRCLLFCPQRDDDVLSIGTERGKLYTLVFPSSFFEQNNHAEWGPPIDLEYSVASLAFSTDGKRLFAIAQNWTLWIGGIQSDGSFNELLKYELEQEGIPVQIAANRDGSNCVAVTKSGNLVIFSVDIQQKKVTERSIQIGNATHIAASSRDHEFYVGTKFGEIFRISDDNNFRFMPPRRSWTGLSRDGSLLGIGTADGKIGFYEISTSTYFSSIEEIGVIKDGCYFNNDCTVAVVNNSNQVIVFEPRIQSDPQRLKLESGIEAIAGAPTAPLLAITELDEHAKFGIKVWCTHPQLKLLFEDQLDWQPTCVSWSEDGKLLVVGGEDLHLYRVENGKVQRYGISFIEWLT